MSNSDFEKTDLETGEEDPSPTNPASLLSSEFICEIVEPCNIQMPAGSTIRFSPQQHIIQVN